DEQMAELTESLNTSLEPFLDYLDGVKAKLGGLEGPAPGSSVGMVSLERVLTSTGGAIVGAGLVVASATGIGHAGAMSGRATVVTGVASQVGALIRSMVNPITLGAVVVGALALNRSRGAAMTDQVKTQAAAGVAEQLRREAGAQAAALAEEVYHQTE